MPAFDSSRNADGVGVFFDSDGDEIFISINDESESFTQGVQRLSTGGALELVAELMEAIMIRLRQGHTTFSIKEKEALHD